MGPHRWTPSVKPSRREVQRRSPGSACPRRLIRRVEGDEQAGGLLIEVSLATAAPGGSGHRASVITMVVAPRRGRTPSPSVIQMSNRSLPSSRSSSVMGIAIVRLSVPAGNRINRAGRLMS